MDTLNALQRRCADVDFFVMASNVLRKAVARFGRKKEWAGRSGAYLCIADASSGLPLFIALVGEVPDDKGEKYLVFCQEKARRLAAYREHQTSYESRDPGQNKWGGAVRGGEFIFSMSGLPELGDEAVMLALLCDLKEATQSPIFGGREPVQLGHQNEYWDELVV